MILDILSHLDRYASMCQGMDKAVAFLSNPELSKLTLGKHVIDGDKVFAVVAKESGKKKDQQLLETHNRYLDIQLVLDGDESMGWKPRSMCNTPNAPYDPDKDLCFYTDAPDTFITVKPGTFAIFFPDDAHMPLIGDGPIHKVIIKLKINE